MIYPSDIFLSILIIILKQGAKRVLFYHKHNIGQALLELFPDIGLDKTKLRRFGANSIFLSLSFCFFFLALRFY